jgi:RNA recognition motif-containing protein
MAMAGQGLTAGPPPRPAHHNSFGQNPGNQLYVGNVRLSAILYPIGLISFQLPYQAGWQDLKDLFRSAGNIIRADINIGADGRPKGSGTVIFETAKDAQQAISACQFFWSFPSVYDVLGMYNGFDWYGRILEVREVSFTL